MNSLRQIIESSPSVRHLGFPGSTDDEEPQPLAPPLWDWSSVCRVLVIRLRSIGDTVLATPSLVALRRFVPHTRIDILLEDWVAPVLDGSDLVDRVITMRPHSASARARIARELHRTGYDVVYNFHGGTTATFLTRATGATHRVGFRNYQYARLHNHIAPSSLEIWQRPTLHSVEQQLALIGWTGVPVTDRPATRLGVSQDALSSVAKKLCSVGVADFETNKLLAVIHPAAAFETKQWAAEKFGRIADELTRRGLTPIVIVSPKENRVANAMLAQDRKSTRLNSSHSQ